MPLIASVPTAQSRAVVVAAAVEFVDSAETAAFLSATAGVDAADLGRALLLSVAAAPPASRAHEALVCLVCVLVRLRRLPSLAAAFGAACARLEDASLDAPHAAASLASALAWFAGLIAHVARRERHRG